jgi:hypothetical protein
MPELQPVASDVDVCATLSAFIHVTVVPTATVRSEGLNALRPRVDAPIGIVTDDDGPLGEGVGAGTGDGEGAGDE